MQELVKTTLCDACAVDERRSDGESYAVRINDHAWQLDLCTSHSQSVRGLIQRLDTIASRLGGSVLLPVDDGTRKPSGGYNSESELALVTLDALHDRYDVCPICAVRSGSRDSLTSHVYSRHGKARISAVEAEYHVQYDCPHCQKRFGSYSSLKQHARRL